MPAICVSDVRKSYGGVQALGGVSLEVHEGEVLALLGPNGAGKTTLVEILEGYRDRDSGTVTVLGMDPREGGRSLRRQVGIVLQECAVHPYLSVREVVTLHAAYYPHPRTVAEVIALTGLQEKADELVRRLSGGQRRRLDLALALIGDPQAIFLDEPTTGFDPSARRNAWQIVRDIRALGRTILLTTHYMDEAQNLADRIVVIAAGRVVAVGSPESIGGRDTAAVRIRFRLPEGVEASSLPVPAHVEDHREVLIETTATTATLHELTEWALQRRIELLDLTVSRPTLEDVYLELTAQ